MKCTLASIAVVAMIFFAVTGATAAEQKAMPSEPGQPVTLPEPPSMPGKGMMGRGMPDTASMIPAEKRAAYDAVTAKYKEHKSKLNQDIFAKTTELNGALAASDLDEVKAKTLAKELGSLYGRLSEIETEERIELRKQGVPFGPYMMQQGMRGISGGGMGMAGPAMQLGQVAPTQLPGRHPMAAPPQ